MTGEELFQTTASNVGLANEVAANPGVNTNVGPVLTFDAANTGLQQSFRLEVLQTNAQFTFDDEEVGGNIPSFDNALSIGDIDNFEDDDARITLTGGRAVQAIAFVIRDSNPEAGEKVTVYSASGSVVLSLPSSGGLGIAQFIGVVADFDITKIDYDEATGPDDVAIADVRFATASVAVPEASSLGVIGVLAVGFVFFLARSNRVSSAS